MAANDSVKSDRYSEYLLLLHTSGITAETIA
jgi:hypothetical protein